VSLSGLGADSTAFSLPFRLDW